MNKHRILYGQCLFAVLMMFISVQSTFVHAQTIDPGAAIAVVQRTFPGNRILGVRKQLSDQDKTVHSYRVKVLAGNGQVRFITVDAVTGNITRP